MVKIKLFPLQDNMKVLETESIGTTGRDITIH